MISQGLIFLAFRSDPQSFPTSENISCGCLFDIVVTPPVRRPCIPVMISLFRRDTVWPPCRLGSHNWTRGFRFGEALHPGPDSDRALCRSLTLSLVNPTTVYQKEDDLLDLDADILCLAETAATRTVQIAFNQAIRTTSYRTFWSAPVPDKITRSDPTLGHTLRGDNLGTAIMTRLPSRITRHTFPPAVWDTCRLNSVVVSTGVMDILIVSTYFQTGKSAEAKIVNNQLLQDILLHVLPIDLPFIIAGDFNMDVRKLDAYTTFSQLGCHEMFDFNRRAFGFELPPTCKGATRFDSMIVHPYLTKYIQRIDIGPEHQFADHRVVQVQLSIPTTTSDNFTWYVPKSWTLFPVQHDIFEEQYSKARISSHFHTNRDPVQQLIQWSSCVEKAVDRTLCQQQAKDPFVYSQSSLPKNFRGRCKSPKPLRLLPSRAPRKDSTGLYEPPIEVTSVKSRQKVRQVRRLRCLERLYRKYRLEDFPCDHWQFLPSYPDLILAWQAIRRANGYGHSWVHWLLQFDAITCVTVDLPSFDLLYCVRQITQYDADLYCTQEAKLRRQSMKHGLELDIQHRSGSEYYKRLKANEVRVLPGFPVHTCAQATIRRTSKGPVTLLIHQPVQFRLFAAARFGTATLRIMEQHDNHLSCQVLQGVVPSHGELIQEVYAFEVAEMAGPFAEYWSQYWSRDTSMEEETDHPWTSLLQSLCDRIPPCAPLQVTWDDPGILANTNRRLKPFKAVGVDGWRAEELQSLPHAAVVDLAKVLGTLWPRGLSTHQLIARVILLAKRNPPTAITDGRPITILGYVSRLTSKLIADQLLRHWASAWPSAISGGLPLRGVQDITFQQQFQIESAKKRSLPWRGFTLDLVKAFNLLPRRVLYHLFVYHGAPPDSVRFWFINLKKMTRRLQVNKAVGPTITMTTGVPEGDSLSVCAMLVVSSAFYWTLQSPSVYPYAYADNWSYLTTSQRDNIVAFRKIQHLVEALRMQIDFAKSWAWGATTDAREEWKQFLQTESPQLNQVSILNSTKDLGCMTHYTNHITLGHLKTKITSAIQRCKRIRFFRTDILQKARFIQTAVWPHAFFGAEHQVVGEKHFRTLRREAATALIGPESQISSWLGVHAFSPQLQDPLLYVISTALTFLRRLFHSNPSLAQDYLQAVINHTGPAVGPAGALARYLTLVGWSLTADGRLTLDGYLSVSIRHDALKQIRQTLRQAWTYYLHRQICHRKGVPSIPFDFKILSRVLRSMSRTDIRQVAYNLTAGYQVGAVKALWTSTENPNCSFCGQPDTHEHQQLHCPAFQHVRQHHPQAISYLTSSPHKLWMPLPVSFPDIATLRQLFTYRGHSTEHTSIFLQNNVLFFYTDGSADTPLQTETRRAAWSVVQFRPDSDTTPFLTIKIQHVQGTQSIARAELAAIAWIVQHVSNHQWPHQVIITTDSQYAINAIQQVTQPTGTPPWHHLANADLLNIIAESWVPSQFLLRKVRSHQTIEDLPPGPERDDALGNFWADHAAVRARLTDHEVVDNLVQRATIWHEDQYRQTKCILKYLADLNRSHVQAKQREPHLHGAHSHHDDSSDWNTLLRLRESYTVSPPFQVFQPDIHPAFLTACVWGKQYADLVLQFCAALKWPQSDIDHTDPHLLAGITWHELALAFIVNTGIQFPTWLRLADNQRAQPFHWQDARVLALPIPKRSLRAQAEAFRTIVLYLQGYTSTPLLPHYSKQGSRSLAQIGWGRQYTGGFPLRPELPNSPAVQKTLLQYTTDLHCKPPYHPDGLVPMGHVAPIFTTDVAAPLTFHQAFLYRRNLRKVWNKHGDLSSVPIPAAPN